MADKQLDVQAILKLYELRREEKMRRARNWYFSEFNPQSALEIAKLIASGYETSEHYRMLTSYWDMAASFVNNGGIDEKVFLDSNTEHIGVFARIEPFIAEMREISGEADYLLHLEQLVMKVPNAKELLEKRRKLFARWVKAKASEQV